MSERTPSCIRCAGGCCEDLVFPLPGLSKDTADFLRVRCGGTVKLTVKAEGFVFPMRCQHLSDSGLCKIYDDRPLVCAVYVAGGEACLETLRRRRTTEQIAHIMGEDDEG